LPILIVQHSDWRRLWIRYPYSAISLRIGSSVDESVTL
jgi:hypothetical protein